MGFGSDFAGYIDLDATMKFLEGEVPERTAYAHAIARRLTTPRGGNPWDPSYGTDLRQFIADPIPLSQAENMIESECRKDERTVDARASIVASADGGTWTVRIICTAINGLAYPLTIQVTAVTVELLNGGA